MTEWINLLLSEPALVEASLAVGLRHHPNSQASGLSHKSHLHAYRAVCLVNQRIGAGVEGLNDGLLTAVFVLSLGSVRDYHPTRSLATCSSIAAEILQKSDRMEISH